jgi:hypothetical protein
VRFRDFSLRCATRSINSFGSTFDADVRFRDFSLRCATRSINSFGSTFDALRGALKNGCL